MNTLSELGEKWRKGWRKERERILESVRESLKRRLQLVGNFDLFSTSYAFALVYDIMYPDYLAMKIFEWCDGIFRINKL